MPWNGGSYPDGNQDLPTNRVGISDNFTWIDNEINKDHYWNDSNANLNGRHKQISIPNSSPVPSVPTDSDGVMYVETVSDNGTDKQVLKHNDGTTIRPMSWGTVWAYCTFNPTTGVIASSQNVASLALASNVFTLTFTEAAPDTNYMIFGSSIYSSGSQRADMVSVYRTEDSGENIAVGSFKFCIISSNSGRLLKTSEMKSSKIHVMAIL